MPPQPKNRKFIAQKQREERQKRAILIGTITVLVIVLGLVGYGLIDRYILQPGTTIVEIGNSDINVTEFEQRVRYERFRRINQLVELINFSQSLGGTPDTFAYFQPQINQVITELQQPRLIGQQVIEALTEELIILEEAEKFGIEISDQVIDREIEKIFGYFPEGTPTPVPTQEPQPTSTLSSLQKTLLPPTSTPTDIPVEEGEEESAPSITPTPEPTEIPPTPENPDPTATPLLKPTEYTEELFEDNYQLAMDNLESEADITEETFRDLVKVFYLREELIKEITSDIQPVQEQVWARHILVDDEETANQLLEQLEDGDAFSELAQEFSTDTASGQRGGDLGWFGRGMMTPVFEEAAYALDVGEISDPIETNFGWHIIQVIGKEERPVDPRTLQELKNQAFSEWLREKRAEYEVEVNENWSEYLPNEPQVPQGVVDYITLQEQQLLQPQLQPQLQPTTAPETE